MDADEKRAKHRIYMAQYRQRKPDRSQESKTYYESHREEIAERRKDSKVRARDRDRQRRRRQDDPTITRRASLARYGMTEADYAAIIEAQGGGCYFCGQPETKARHGVRNLSLDHDHATRRVRGAVCIGCNISVGYAERGQVSRLLRDIDRLSTYLGVNMKLTLEPRNERARMVTEKWLAGRSEVDLGIEYGVTTSRIWQILGATIRTACW